MAERFELKEADGRGQVRFRIRNQRGSVLLVLIITMVVLAALTAAILPTRFTSEMGQISASGAMKAYYLAEAGGRYTIPRLQALSSGAHSFKFSDGSPFFEIEKISNTLFTSTGVVAEGGIVEARVAISYRLGSRFDYALFGGDGVTTGSSVVIDSYSSSAEPTDGEHGDVGTNADNLDGMTAGTEVHGELEVLADRDMTPEALPSGYESWEDKTAELGIGNMPNGTPVDLPEGDYRTDSIAITNGSTITIKGAVRIYVAGTTEAKSNATLNISAGASLTIYAGGDLNLSDYFLVTPDQIPAHFLIYGLAGCQDIEWGDACGAIYAPAADILVINNAVAYGALIGKTVTLQNDVEVHYDEDLQGIGGGDSSHVAQYFTPN